MDGFEETKPSDRKTRALRLGDLTGLSWCSNIGLRAPMHSYIGFRSARNGGTVDGFNRFGKRLLTGGIVESIAQG